MKHEIVTGCVYCGREATTVDHVLARCLLEKPYSNNLMTVPSCRPCNESYGRDEEYFLALMAQTGFLPSLMDKVAEDGVVDRMLQRHESLDTHFQETMQVAADGRVLIVPNEARVARVALKTAFGLYLHRYKPKRNPSMDDFFILKPMHDRDPNNFIVTMTYNDKFQRRRWTHLQTVQADSRKVQVFDYMFVRNWVYYDFGRLFCIIFFHKTIRAAVRCPHPSPIKRKGQLHRTANAIQNGLFSGI